jgi:hypothetical protein
MENQKGEYKTCPECGAKKLRGCMLGAARSLFKEDIV